VRRQWWTGCTEREGVGCRTNGLPPRRSTALGRHHQPCGGLRRNAISDYCCILVESDLPAPARYWVYRPPQLWPLSPNECLATSSSLSVHLGPHCKRSVSLRWPQRPSQRVMARLSHSPIPTAIAGWYMKSPRDCPGASTRTPHHSTRRLSSQARSDAQQPHMASTRSGPANKMRVGRTGTRNTSLGRGRSLIPGAPVSRWLGDPLSFRAASLMRT
jgi:hypothetical protein